jgi:hypothetical protein
MLAQDIPTALLLHPSVGAACARACDVAAGARQPRAPPACKQPEGARCRVRRALRARRSGARRARRRRSHAAAAGCDDCGRERHRQGGARSYSTSRLRALAAVGHRTRGRQPYAQLSSAHAAAPPARPSRSATTRPWSRSATKSWSARTRRARCVEGRTRTLAVVRQRALTVRACVRSGSGAWRRPPPWRRPWQRRAAARSRRPRRTRRTSTSTSASGIAHVHTLAQPVLTRSLALQEAQGEAQAQGQGQGGEGEQA